MSVATRIAKQHKHAEVVKDFLERINGVVLDKQDEIKLTLCCIFAGGHLLIEDLPGMGKTTLVKAFGKLLGLDLARIQFTNDLLPGDIIGSNIYDATNARFNFHRGPIFAQLVLADEINRATPKTQSACLQAMEEYQVTSDGSTYDLPRPFFLIATQNPRQNIGTFPLPESQLDRFLMKIHLGYPNRNSEKELLMGVSRHKMIEKLPPILGADKIIDIQADVKMVHASDLVISYLQDLVDKSRALYQGLSPRASLGILRAAKAWAFIENRDFVVPEDIQHVAMATMNHRLSTTEDPYGINGDARVKEILESVAVK